MSRLVTPDELLRTPDAEHFELIDGVPREKPNGAEADHIAGVVLTALVNYADRRRRGHAYGGKTGYNCFPGRPNHVRVPDGSFVTAGRLPGERSPPGYIDIPPDIAIEVASPRELAAELEESVADYRSVGVRLIWVIYPPTRMVLVRRPDRTCTELDEAGTLSGEDVLPGFACPVADLFA